jgi:hypothetical protein
MSEWERRYLHLLKSVPDYPFNFEKDLPFIRDLLVDFPSLDLEKEIKAGRPGSSTGGSREGSTTDRGSEDGS